MFYSFVVSAQTRQRGEERREGGENGTKGEKAEGGNGLQNVVLCSRIELVMLFGCVLFFAP